MSIPGYVSEVGGRLSPTMMMAVLLLFASCSDNDGHDSQIIGPI